MSRIKDISERSKVGSLSQEPVSFAASEADASYFSKGDASASLKPIGAFRWIVS